jgi:glycosyltransferase involved in cell wall biosynthesis
MAAAEPALTLCMIVRDEEARLGCCLASVRGVVDELVVVDTGSRDGTRELARASGARVLDFAWCDDFSAARNHGLAAARGDWVLVLDADEELVSADARARLLDFARTAGALAGQLELENVSGAGERARVLLTRFFPRAGVCYRRRIHEELVRAGEPLRGRPTGVRARHDGYAAELMTGRAKAARNEALLRRALAENPEDGHDWYHLGRALEVAERHEEALAAYEAAVLRVRDEDPHLAHLLESAATCLRRLGRSRQALDWLGQVEHDFAERADTVFLLALLAMDVGELARAERGFLRCLELGAKERPAGVVEQSALATGVGPAHNLGVLYEFSGRPREARAAYERALEMEPGHAGARAGLERLGK